MLPISELWVSFDAKAWASALEHYWSFVRPENRALEKSLEELDLKRLHEMDAQEWYIFLKDEYFRWKYTAPNRYASTTRLLKAYSDQGMLETLNLIKNNLLNINPRDTRAGLELAFSIRGLGPPGASGLLALMHPKFFGTVDQFVVKSLRLVKNLPNAAAIDKINPDSIKINDAILLIEILKKKADDNNKALKTKIWTPRLIDKVLWTYGR